MRNSFSSGTKTAFVRLTAFASVALVLGCASGHCRQTGAQANQQVNQSANQSPQTTAPTQNSSAATPLANASSVSSTATNPSSPAANRRNQAAPSSQVAPQTSSAATAAVSVLIYKYDGSLQCGMGKAVSPEEMEKELRGIPVSFREKRPDGMMRIQVCGAATGMANVYTIPQARLADAEKRGFRTWTF